MQTLLSVIAQRGPLEDNPDHEVGGDLQIELLKPRPHEGMAVGCELVDIQTELRFRETRPTHPE